MASALAEVRARKLSTPRAQSPRRTAEVLDVQQPAPAARTRRASRERMPSFTGLLSAKGRSSSRDKDKAGSSKSVVKAAAPPAAAADAPSAAEAPSAVEALNLESECVEAHPAHGDLELINGFLEHHARDGGHHGGGCP